ncbi:MAG: hypothetical protein HY719_00020 [Planctomycetes bacterium]|nr:hypothetical protein [Planctomycetota bacterium]
MRLVIDGKDSPLEVDSAGSLGNMLVKVRQYLADRNRVIQTCYVDSHLLTEQIERDNLETPIADLREMKIVSITQEGLALTVLRSIAANFTKFTPELTEIAAGLQRGDAIRSATRLQKLLPEMVLVLGAVQNAASVLRAPLDQVRMERGTVAERAQAFAKILETVKRAIELSDAVTLSDMIEYELPPMLDEWLGVIHTLIAHGERIP